MATAVLIYYWFLIFPHSLQLVSKLVEIFAEVYTSFLPRYFSDFFSKLKFFKAYDIYITNFSLFTNPLCSWPCNQISLWDPHHFSSLYFFLLFSTVFHLKCFCCCPLIKTIFLLLFLLLFYNIKYFSSNELMLYFTIYTCLSAAEDISRC